MSHIDARAEFSAAQVVTATAISTNVMNLKGTGLAPNATENIGAPSLAYLVITVANAAAAAGAATVTATLESADDAGLAASPVVHASTGAKPVADLTAGATVAVIPLPAGDYKQYLGVRYTVGTGPLTAGAFNAHITLDPRIYRTFADGKPVTPTA